jgi:type II secretion system protein G
MRRQKGFTLIELLIVVAIIGIIAAIAIPNLLNAINRGRQKRTMGDIRTLATAVEAYAVDFNFYPKIADGPATDLSAHITPTYLRRIPERDGWNNPIYWAGDDTLGNNYSFWSAGKDGTGSDTIDAPGGATTNFDADICYSAGTFTQWPEGMQTN